MSANNYDKALIERLTVLKMNAASFGSQQELQQQIATLFTDIEISRLKALNNLPEDYDPKKYRD